MQFFGQIAQKSCKYAYDNNDDNDSNNDDNDKDNDNGNDNDNDNNRLHNNIPDLVIGRGSRGHVIRIPA